MNQDYSHINHVGLMVAQCEDYLGEQAGIRQRASEYYEGDVPELPVDEDEEGRPIRSTVVSKDVRSIIKKLKPSIMRTLLANDRIAEYEPVSEDDEESAKQATEYVNLVVVPESNVENALHDAVMDAVLRKTGILKWSAYRKQQAEVHHVTDVDDDAFLGLEEDPELTVLDHETSEETDPEVLALSPNARRHSFRLLRTVSQTEVRMDAVPRELFLISPGAENIEDAPLVGEIQTPTRSELVSRGYDRKKVDSLSDHGSKQVDEADKQAQMGDDFTQIAAHNTKALETVKIYEVYVRLDLDDDGIAEMYKIVFGDSGDTRDGEEKSRVVLEQEPVAEAPYADVIAERDAHQFEGHSVFEDVEDIQRIKTSLLRGTLDNIYWQNNPQPEVDLDVVADPNAVFSPKFGQPILKKKGYAGTPAVTYHTPPFYARDAFDMLPYMDEVAKDRTGITEQSGGLDPEQIANVNNGVAQLAAESGIAQAEMIIRSLARGGIRKAFRGLLKLVVAHHDQPRSVKIRGEWKTYDPRSWNTNMDCKVNVGLGAGSKERDMAVLQIILGLQREIIAGMGPRNPFVKPIQLYRTLAKITETAGFPSADPYFTEPSEAEVEAALAAAENQPDPQAQKVQRQIELEEAKAQAAQVKEQAQMQADLQVKAAEREKDLEIAALKAQLEYLMHQDRMALEYAKHGQVGPSMPQVNVPEQING